ncbi:MAG: SH3 domain-containing protein [Caldilineaceae bacterium]
MTLLSHAHTRIALLMAFALTLLLSTRLSPGHLQVDHSDSVAQVSVEPLVTSPSQEAALTTVGATASSSESGQAVDETTAIFVIGSAIANLRSEPSIDALMVGVANQGQQFTITGKSPNLEWIEVCCVNGSKAWIASQLGVIYGSLEQTPIRPFVPPTTTR